MTTHATEPIPRSTIDTTPGDHRIGRITLFLATLAVGGAAIGNYLTQTPEETGTSNIPYEGAPSTDILSLTIEEGARLRHDPFVADTADGSSNRIDTIDAALTINIINGVDRVYVHEDQSMTWYGITLSSLSESGINFGDDDTDRIGWVSEKQATVVYEDEDPSV